MATPKQHSGDALNEKRPLPTAGFGETAIALDVMLQLMIDLLVQRDKTFGADLMGAIDTLAQSIGPTPGIRIALLKMRAIVEESTRA